jgi:hypothetical protein
VFASSLAESFLVLLLEYGIIPDSITKV